MAGSEAGSQGSGEAAEEEWLSIVMEMDPQATLAWLYRMPAAAGVLPKTTPPTPNV